MDNAKKTHKQLFEVRGLLFNKAQRLWTTALVLTLLVQFSALFLIKLENIIFFIISFLVFSLPVIIDWLKELAKDVQNKADKVRRALLYENALGKQITRRDQAIFLSYIGRGLDNAPDYEEPFYMSDLAKSPQRLADNAIESAFFTSHLAKKMGFLFSWISLLSVGLFIFLFYFSIEYITQVDNLKDVLRGGIATISFLLSANMFWIIKQYNDLQNESRQVLERLGDFRNKADFEIHELLILLEDYHLILIQSPPIFNWVYQRNKNQLNNIYRTTHYYQESQNG